MHYSIWNGYGTPSLIIGSLSSLMSVTKRSISRILVLLVSLGYGVVRPSLGDEMNKVLILGGSYFCLALLYQTNALIPGEPTQQKLSEPQADMNALIILLIAAVDTTFYIWIFSSLHNIIVSLTVRKQSVKLNLYTKFRAVLIFSLFFSLGWALYSMLIMFGDHVDRNWKSRWTIDALWEVTYLVIFVAIAVLWAPSKNAQRYTYSSELQSDDHNIELPEIPSVEPDAEYGGSLDDADDPFQVINIIICLYNYIYF